MIDPKCSKEDSEICLNNNKCHLCFDRSMFKRPKWMDIRDRQIERKKNNIPKKKKEGMSFEKSIAAKINRKNKSNSSSIIASRRPNSGAIWSMPGDIVTKEQLIECKERGSTNARGESQITIQKIQLSKIQQEALSCGKAPLYIFSFKGDTEAYVVKNFEYELELLEQIEILKNRIKELEG